METNIHANANIGTNLETSHTLDFSDRLYKIAIAFIAVVGVVGLGWVSSQFGALPQNAPHEISVSGEGRAYVKPNIALMNFGVRAEAVKSQDAVNESNAKMNEVIKAVKALGVEDKDIQTSYYNLSPIYGTEVVPMGAGGSPKRGETYGEVYIDSYPVQNNKVVGYALEQQVQVKIRNFDHINSVLDVAAQKGANTIGSLQFTVDDMEKVRAEAREKAIKQAKEKAGSLFRQAGLRSKKLVNISEGYGYPQSYAYGMGAAMEKTADATAPNIQTGQMEITTTVTLTYRVQ